MTASGIADPEERGADGGTEAPPSRLLSVSEVATELHYTDPSTVRMLIRTGQLPATRIEGSKEYWVSEDDVRAYQRKPRGSPRRISDQKWAEIVHAVVVDEVPVKDVAEREGINFVTIYRHLKRRGLIPARQQSAQAVERQRTRPTTPRTSDQQRPSQP